MLPWTKHRATSKGSILRSLFLAGSFTAASLPFLANDTQPHDHQAVRGADAASQIARHTGLTNEYGISQDELAKLFLKANRNLVPSFPWTKPLNSTVAPMHRAKSTSISTAM